MTEAVATNCICCPEMVFVNDTLGTFFGIQKSYKIIILLSMQHFQWNAILLLVINLKNNECISQKIFSKNEIIINSFNLIKCKNLYFSWHFSSKWPKSFNEGAPQIILGTELKKDPKIYHSSNSKENLSYFKSIWLVWSFNLELFNRTNFTFQNAAITKTLRWDITLNIVKIFTLCLRKKRVNHFCLE